MHPFWGHRPTHQQVTEPAKFWSPEDDYEKNLFEEAKQEVKLFLMSKNEGVDVNKMLEMIQKYGTKGEVKFKEMGFQNFNAFLFHIDDVYELRTTGNILYLFFKGEVDENQEHIRSFVQEQKKDPGDTRFIATKENTYVVPSHYLIKPPKSALLATPHHLLPNPQPLFQQQQQNQFYYQSMQVPQFYMGIPLQHQLQQSYNMTNFLQNPGLQYQLAYNQQHGQMLMNVFANQQQHQSLNRWNNNNYNNSDAMLRQQQLALSQNGQHPLFNHLSVPVQKPCLTIHPQSPCPIHPLNSLFTFTPPQAKTKAPINNCNNDSNDGKKFDKESTDAINENQSSSSSNLESINSPVLNFTNPDTTPKKCLLNSEETASSTIKKPGKKRKISLREAVDKMLEDEQKQTICDNSGLNDKPVNGDDDSSSSSSSSTLVPDSSTLLLDTTSNCSIPSTFLSSIVPGTENNSESSLKDETSIEDFKFATISPHSDVTIKEKVTTRNFTSLQQALEDLLRMEEEEEMRQQKEEKKEATNSKNSTESDSLINLVENLNHSSLEVKEKSDIQEQQQSNNVKMKNELKPNCIGIKQIQLVSCGWTSYRLLGVDAYSHFILKPSDPKVNEYYDKEMEKMEEFYSSVDNQYQYHLKMDDMKIGMFVVIRIPLVKQNNMNMTASRRYIRAKIFYMEDQDKTGFISCLGVDDFIEYMVHFNDIFRLKVEFSRPTARAIMTVLEGTEGCFCLPDIARAFRKCQSQIETKIHPIVKVQVLQEKHPLLQSPIVKIETKDGRDLFQILLEISPSISKQSCDETLCKINGNMNSSYHSFNTYQKKVFNELMRRGYIGNQNPII